MAKLLFIKAATNRPPVQETGDLVGVYHSGHQFSPTEHDKFLIVNVPNFSKEQIDNFIANTLLPKLLTIDKIYGPENSNGRWLNNADGKWYKLKRMPKFMLNFKRLKADKIGLIESGTLSKSQVLKHLETYADQVIVRKPENLDEEAV